MSFIIDRAKDTVAGRYSYQKSRAKKFGVELSYTKEELVAHLTPLGNCPYCGVHLIPSKFQIDHIDPVSRGGSWDLKNLQNTCTSCNRRKHKLNDTEYRALLDFLATQSDLVRENVLARLAAGGAWLATKF